MTKRIMPPTIFLLAVGLMVGLHLAFPLRTVLVWPWRLSGVLPLAFGVVLNLWADRLFKDGGTTVKPFETSTSLIDTGPFRLSRHPMYLGMTAILLGLWLLLGTLMPLLVVPLFVLILSLAYIPAEERMMLQEFGEDYRTYRKKVRRWV